MKCRVRDGIAVRAHIAAIVAFTNVVVVSAARAQGTPNPAEVKGRLRDILSRPEYQPEIHTEGYFAKFLHWLADEWQALVDWWNNLWPKSSYAGHGAPMFAVQYIFIGFFIVLGAWLLARLIGQWSGSRSTRDKTRTRAHTLEEFEAETVTEPDAWLVQARKYAAEGDHRRAFRAVFIAILLQLDSAGLLRYDRSRTNGDYVRLLRTAGTSDLFEPFRTVAGEFDLRWYGHRATSQLDFDRVLNDYDRFRALIASRASAASTRVGGGR